MENAPAALSCPELVPERASNSPLRLSDVGIDERATAKTVAKINQINLERESIRQSSENERQLKFISMIT
eukprot:6213015-Pleurochrysis_carterae.AAC.2